MARHPSPSLRALLVLALIAAACSSSPAVPPEDDTAAPEERDGTSNDEGAPGPEPSDVKKWEQADRLAVCNGRLSPGGRPTFGRLLVGHSDRIDLVSAGLGATRRCSPFGRVNSCGSHVLQSCRSLDRWS
jgi:hypothetical protein